MNERERHIYALCAALGIAPTKDDGAWTVLYGESTQEGVAGYGATPHAAILDWFNRMSGVERKAEDTK